MAEWKKVVVSGSGVAQLSNDANYLINSQSSAMLSGSFSGSFQGDGSGLIGVTADGTISGSVQVTVQDTTGFSGLQSNISSSITSLSASVDAHLDANISALSASVDTHLDANISALSASAHADRVNKISVLSASVDTHLDSNISSLSGSAHTARRSEISDLSGSAKTQREAQKTIIDARLNAIETFTGSLDNDFATDAELAAATSSLSSSAHTQRTSISGALASTIANISSTTLTNGSFDVELDSTNGELVFTEGQRIGDKYNQGAGTLDIFAPSGAAHVELNYGDQDFVYLDGRKVGIQVENDGTTLEWTFYGQGADAGVLNAPGDIIIPSNKEFNGGKGNFNTVTGSTNFNTIHNLPTLVSGSSQVTVSDTTGYTAFSASIATYTDSKIGDVSGSAHTARRSEISDLSASVDTHLDAHITALSASVDTHLDANISSLSGSSHTARRSEISDLSGSAHTQRNNVISTLSASVDTHLDANINAISSSAHADRVAKVAVLSASAATALASQGSDVTDLAASQSAFDTAFTLDGQNVTVAGNLEVSGTTTTVDSTTVEFADNIISLNGTGAANGGIEVNDANGPASGSLIWNGTTNQWIAGGKGSEAKVLLGTGDDVVSGSAQVTVQSTTGFAALQANVTASFAPITLSGSAHTARRSEISDLSGSAHTQRVNVISTLSASVDTHLDAHITALSASVDTHLDANISSLSGSSHTARRSEISDLSGSAHSQRVSEITALSASANSQRKSEDTVLSGSAHSDRVAKIAVLSGSAHTDRVAKIAVLSGSAATAISNLSASVDTHLDANINSLSASAHSQRKSEDAILSASAHTARATLASSLILSGSSGNDIVNLKTDTLTFAGEGGVAVNVTNNTVTIDTTDILSGSDQIVTGLLNQDVNFGTGAITASGYSGDGSGLSNLTVTQNATIDDSFTSATTHTVTHNFNSKNVIVQVYDDNDLQIIPEDIDVSNVNQAVLTFSSATTGHAVVARGGHIVSGSIPFANLLAVPTLVSGSSQVTVQSTDGFTELQSNISSSFAVSSSAHTQREAIVATLSGSAHSDRIAKIAVLSASVDSHLDSEISVLSASVDAHLDANISALSASVDTHLDANISALSASVDTHLDANISALSASAHTARGTIDSSFTIAGTSGTDSFTTGGTLTFAGTTNEIETTVTDDQIRIGIVTNPTLSGDVTITGDLTVTGDTIEQRVTNLNVEDKFILLNSGSAASDAGIVINGQGAAFGWDESENRFALDFSGATFNQTTLTSDAYVAAVVTSDDANYQKVGNIRIDSDDIYIYV